MLQNSGINLGLGRIKYVNNELATNKSLRDRFEVSEKNYPTEKVRYQNCLSDKTISSSFLLRVLAHPATLPVFLITVGAVGLAFGGIGLAGISIGLSMFVTQIVGGAGTVSTAAGVAVGIYRFFSTQKPNREDPAPPSDPNLSSSSLLSTQP